MTRDNKITTLERMGYKIQFVHSSATQYLRYTPVIAKKYNDVIRGNSVNDLFKKIKGY
jgi:hypothetical protein